MKTRLQRSAVHEAGHAVVADFAGIEVRIISMLPRTDAAGEALAHVGFGERLDGLTGAAVLLAGEAALELAEGDGYPVPEMPASMPWHRRSISLGEADRGDGRGGDRDALRGLDLPDGAAAFARRTARGVLSEDWGAVYTLADRLLRDGVISGAKLARFLHPGTAAEERGEGGKTVEYVGSVTTPGLLRGGSGEIEGSGARRVVESWVWGPLGVKAPRFSRRRALLSRIRAEGFRSPS